MKENTFDPRYSRKGKLISVAEKTKKLRVTQCASAPVCFTPDAQETVGGKNCAVPCFSRPLKKQNKQTKNSIRLKQHPVVYYWF